MTTARISHKRRACCCIFSVVCHKFFLRVKPKSGETVPCHFLPAGEGKWKTLGGSSVLAGFICVCMTGLEVLRKNPPMLSLESSSSHFTSNLKGRDGVWFHQTRAWSFCILFLEMNPVGIIYIYGVFRSGFLQVIPIRTLAAACWISWRQFSHFKSSYASGTARVQSQTSKRASFSAWLWIKTFLILITLWRWRASFRVRTPVPPTTTRTTSHPVHVAPPVGGGGPSGENQCLP